MTAEAIHGAADPILECMDTGVRRLLAAHCRLCGFDAEEFFAVDSRHIILVDTQPPVSLTGGPLYLSPEKSAALVERAFADSAVCFGWKFQDLVLTSVLAEVTGGRPFRWPDNR